MLKWILPTAAACALIAGTAIAPSPAGAQEVTLRLHTLIPPPANPYKTFLQPWADKVAAASSGRIRVDLYPSMQLGGKPQQLVEQVKDGVVDLAWTLPGYTAGRFPKSEVVELPFLHTTPQATTMALQDVFEKDLQDEWKDYHVLLLHVHAGTMFMTKTRPVRTVADIAGLKLRTPTRVTGMMLTALGATPLGAPVNELPQMIAKGVIDGVILTYEIAPAYKMQDLVDHFTTLAGPQPRMNTSMFSFLMNKASYAKLSAANRKVIDDLSGRGIAEWVGQNWADIEIPAKKLMASKSKNHFYVMPESEVAKLKAKTASVTTDWIKEMNAKGIDGAQLVADMKAAIAKYTPSN